MQNRLVKLLIVFLFSTLTSPGQDEATIREYINTYRDLAISEMQRTGVPASIKLAQGIHETGAGTSKLVLKSNNHFGIKCKSDWSGQKVSHTDDAPNECFRKYDSPTDSYKDHSDFLRKSNRYASLFLLDPTDYAGWANGLKKAGYATNPKYAQVIIRLVEEYNLQDFSLIALGRKKAEDLVIVKSETTVEGADIVKGPVVSQTDKESGTEKDKKEESIKKPVQAYPEGEFMINETKVIFAKKGTPYLSIAEQYSIPLARLFDFNDMKTAEMVEKDQLIFIMRKRKTGNDQFHIVGEGESVHDIAQIQAIRMESLIEYNNIKPGMNPLAGTVLYLQSKAPAKPGPVSGK